MQADVKGEMTVDDDKKIVKELLERALAKGMTLQNISDALGVSRQAVASYGKGTAPTITVFIKLMRLVGASGAELFDKKSKPLLSDMDFTYEKNLEKMRLLLEHLKTLTVQNTYSEIVGNRFAKPEQQALEKLLNIGERQIGGQSSRKPNVMVWGEPSTGKSTFCNKLIGIDLLPTGILAGKPRTPVVIKLLHSSEKPRDLKGFNDTVIWFENISSDDTGVIYTRHESLAALETDILPDSNKKILSIDVYSSADILREINLIDTPGDAGQRNEKFMETLHVCIPDYMVILGIPRAYFFRAEGTSSLKNIITLLKHYFYGSVSERICAVASMVLSSGKQGDEDEWTIELTGEGSSSDKEFRGKIMAIDLRDRELSRQFGEFFAKEIPKIVGRKFKNDYREISEECEKHIRRLQKARDFPEEVRKEKEKSISAFKSTVNSEGQRIWQHSYDLSKKDWQEGFNKLIDRKSIEEDLKGKNIPNNKDGMNSYLSSIYDKLDNLYINCCRSGLKEFRAWLDKKREILPEHLDEQLGEYIEDEEKFEKPFWPFTSAPSIEEMIRNFKEGKPNTPILLQEILDAMGEFNTLSGDFKKRFAGKIVAGSQIMRDKYLGNDQYSGKIKEYWDTIGSDLIDIIKWVEESCEQPDDRLDSSYYDRMIKLFEKIKEDCAAAERGDI